MRVLLILLTGAVVAGAVWFALTTRAPRELRYPAPPARPSGPALPRESAVGMSGCLASACHGANAERTLRGEFDALTWMSSGTCWLAVDPHRGTYDLLTDHPRRPVTVTAAEMMKRLGSSIPATEDERCLACHTNPSLAAPGSTTDTRVLTLRREGIGCESCHGNAGGWLREHTAWSPRTDRAAAGMMVLANTSDRATACVGCHVGAPADAARGYPVRDMTHDMIAVGHPRLNFDYAEYSRRLPRHWHESSPTNPAGEWLLGRVIHAEAACRLLADRAERAASNDPRTPWPELAEFNCAACHHAFAFPTQPGTRRTGTLRWQTLWPVTAEKGMGGEELPGLLAELHTPRPAPPARVIEPARRAARELGTLRRSLASVSDGELERRARALFPKTLAPPADTDTLGQMLHGLAALERLSPRPEVLGEFDRAFEQVQKRDWAGARMSLDALLGRMRR